MTVCIAAIAQGATLIGVSDRMLTSGDVEFETGQSKIWVFSKSIVALIAGDAAVQAELIRQVDNAVKEWIAAAPDVWVNVRDVALLYCKKYREHRKLCAEAAILSPLGLDIESFLKNDSNLPNELVSKIADDLTVYEFPEEKDGRLEVIFMGMDNDGPLEGGEKRNYAKIYVTEADKLSFRTTVGFAAIGIGKAHAESQFMFSGHWPKKSLEDTVLLTYAAKRRAESAPGVGKATDMISIGPGLGSLVRVDDKYLEILNKLYEKSQRPIARATKIAQQETKELISQIRQDYAEKSKKDNAQSETSEKTSSETPA